MRAALARVFQGFLITLSVALKFLLPRRQIAEKALPTPFKKKMASSPVHSSGQAAILKHTRIMLNTTFTTAPVMPSLNENLLQRDVFDYDFNRERIFLEIAEAEIAAMRKAEEEEKSAAVEKDDSDDELARQSAKLSLSSSMSSTGHQDGTPTKPRSTSEEDVAAAISASLREY